MTASQLNRFWAFTIVLLVAIIIIGGIIIWSKYSPSQPIEVSLPLAQAQPGTIYIGGAVTTPGFYPGTSRDSLEALIQVAGGTTSNADLSRLKIYISKVDEEPTPQKIDINRAEVWLLEALPQIGQTLAQRIVDYRQQNGPFRNTTELTKVAGIGSTTYEQIKQLITVAD